MRVTECVLLFLLGVGVGVVVLMQRGWWRNSYAHLHLLAMLAGCYGCPKRPRHSSMLWPLPPTLSWYLRVIVRSWTWKWYARWILWRLHRKARRVAQQRKDIHALRAVDEAWARYPW